ncbi:hypothetical protein ACHWQZ_G008550 [Mnemiopsis leidyi]
MSYTCQQEIQVLEDPDKCNQAFEEHILTPALQFIGLDCEWNTDRPVSLLQVATPTVVLLVRICKLNFTLPQNVKLVLEDPTICKVGVNIEHDSEKLGEDCFCTIKSWVDLRHVAIRSVSWGPCIVKQVEDHEYSLLLYDQTDPNSESAKVANGRRLSWCPKMGLESLIGDCLDKTLPKNTSARWSDDWECSKLQLNQRTYAANDATASLDIFVALVFASVTGHPLPFDMSFDVDYLLKKYASELEIAVNELLDKEFKQTKEDMTKIYKLVEKIDPDLDIKAYYTKPSSTKTQKKNAQKEFYKKQAREAAKQKSSEKFPKRPNSFVVPTETDPLPADDLPDPSQDLDSSRVERTESPLPCSTTDDDQGSESSYTSSNYRSVGSKASKPNGRGRGRGKPASSIGSSRNVESDNDLSVKRGRGRGRGAMLETRAPKPRDDVEIDTEKVVFSSYDIRYQNADENETRPDTLNLEERSRNPTTSSQASTVTYRSIHPDQSSCSPPLRSTPTTPILTSLSSKPKEVLFLTDSILKHTPEHFLRHVGLRCTKKVNYRLTGVFHHEPEFALSDCVVIACGVNDLARYNHTPDSLSEYVVPRLVVTCSQYQATTFLFSSVLETNHGWLNDWIGQFNLAMFEAAAKIPNVFFFDAHSVLVNDPVSDPRSGSHVFRPNDDIHISDDARRVVTDQLALGIKLLVSLNNDRFDAARTILRTWEWPLRSYFRELRSSSMKNLCGAIPSI